MRFAPQVGECPLEPAFRSFDESEADVAGVTEDSTEDAGGVIVIEVWARCGAADATSTGSEELDVGRSQAEALGDRQVGAVSSGFRGLSTIALGGELSDSLGVLYPPLTGVLELSLPESRVAGAEDALIDGATEGTGRWTPTVGALGMAFARHVHSPCLVYFFAP